ncbi:hypothetical protein [Ruegeria jejuensis]|uniref:hypothetical protein n=1 Tax=Ruegeria jejuensis TaxID=3233338 RepID=UPI00355B6680
MAFIVGLSAIDAVGNAKPAVMASPAITPLANIVLSICCSVYWHFCVNIENDQYDTTSQYILQNVITKLLASISDGSGRRCY